MYGAGLKFICFQRKEEETELFFQMQIGRYLSLRKNGWSEVVRVL